MKVYNMYIIRSHITWHIIMNPDKYLHLHIAFRQCGAEYTKSDACIYIYIYIYIMQWYNDNIVYVCHNVIILI